MAPTVKHCCCGCSLKTGTIIIGVIHVVFGIIGVIYCSVKAAGSKQMTPEMARQHNITEEGREIINYIMRAESYICIILAIIETVGLILAVLLLVATRRENPRMILPWVIYAIIMTVLSVILYFVIMVIFFVYSATGEGVGVLFALIITTPITVYLIIVVDSYRRELLGQRTPGKM